jgi:hypothetical protein
MQSHCLNNDSYLFPTPTLPLHYQDGASTSPTDYFNAPYEPTQFNTATQSFGLHSHVADGYPMYYSTAPKAIESFRPSSSSSAYLFDTTDNEPQFTYLPHQSPSSLSSSLGSSPHLSDVFLSDASSSPDPVTSPLRQFDAQPYNNNNVAGPSHPHIPYRNVPPPVPVPHLIKRSRGRQVPTISSESSYDALDRSFVCTVQGCGKGFQRAEHLKRHVRSIHTNDKRMSASFPLWSKPISHSSPMI